MKMTIITTEKTVCDAPGKTVLLSFSRPQDEYGEKLHRRIEAFYSHKEKQCEKRLKDMANNFQEGELMILFPAAKFCTSRRNF